MSEKREDSLPVIESAESRRTRLFRIIAWVTAVSSVSFLILLIILAMATGQAYWWSLIATVAGLVAFDLVSLWLDRSGHLQWAIGIFSASLTATVFVLMYLVGGVTGPLVTMLVVLPVLTGLLGGASGARWMGMGVLVLYLAMFALQQFGILVPVPIVEPGGVWLHLGVTLLTLGGLAIIVSLFANQVQSSLVAAQEREVALAGARRRAEEAAQAAREANEREVQALRRLRETVRRYVIFMERVGAGQYDARLPLEQESEERGAHELHVLGEYLNSMVERLVSSLGEQQRIQQRYTERAWEQFMQTGQVDHVFGALDVENPDEQRAWQRAMAQAVSKEQLVVEDKILAFPIIVNRQVLGVIGSRRTEANWGEADLALVEDAARQLSQTIESLRLLDETQRNAAREQLTREITDKMRGTLDWDDLMQVTIEQVARAMAAKRVFVQWIEQ